MSKYRLSKEAYLALKKFKKGTNESRKGKIFKDHANHLYEVDSDGSIRRLSREQFNSRIIDSSHERDTGPAIRSTDY